MDTNLWKDKGELKKYLENLGIEYRYGCYQENRPEVCHLLGDYLLSIDHSQEKAAEIYKKNCDENKYGLSCDAFGRLSFKGDGTTKSLLASLDYFVKGCDLKEYRSCYHAAQLLGNENKKFNKVITPDPERAINMLWTSCLSGRSVEACTHIHSMYLHGYHGKPPDFDKAYKYGLICCDQNDYQCCHNLAKMHNRGDGVERDEAKAKYFSERTKDLTKNIAHKPQRVVVDKKSDF